MDSSHRLVGQGDRRDQQRARDNNVFHEPQKMPSDIDHRSPHADVEVASYAARRLGLVVYQARPIPETGSFFFPQSGVSGPESRRFGTHSNKPVFCHRRSVTLTALLQGFTSVSKQLHQRGPPTMDEASVSYVDIPRVSSSSRIQRLTADRLTPRTVFSPYRCLEDRRWPAGLKVYNETHE